MWVSTLARTGTEAPSCCIVATRYNTQNLIQAIGNPIFTPMGGYITTDFERSLFLWQTRNLTVSNGILRKRGRKILEYQKRLKDLEAQKIEEENAQIVQMVKAVHLDGAQLAAFLSAYASGEIALPQPDADYTDEQEETEDEA